MFSNISEQTANEFISRLESTGNYKVLKRIPEPQDFEITADLKIAAYVDTETTGFDPVKDSIIQLSVMFICYDEKGRIVGLKSKYNSFNDPGFPIPEHITKFTGITTEMVKGYSIKESDLNELFYNVKVIIAHNAGFDRPMLENNFNLFKSYPWACSQKNIPWRDFPEFGSEKLEFLLFKHGYFYRAHDSQIDCLAGSFLLSQDLPDGTGAMQTLLTNARKNDVRIWACNSAFDTKDVLKANGYYWNGGEDGRPKSWHKYISIDNLKDECQWLTENVYKSPALLNQFAKVQVFDPYFKFSTREPEFKMVKDIF